MNPRTLSEMLAAIATQTQAHSLADLPATPAELRDLATTLHACARAAEDLEAEAMPPGMPLVLPANVVRFPGVGAAR